MGVDICSMDAESLRACFRTHLCRQLLLQCTVQVRVAGAVGARECRVGSGGFEDVALLMGSVWAKRQGLTISPMRIIT